MIFRNWVIQNFPFLEDDFDALTDYELFCKMMEYVLKLSDDNEEFKTELQEFRDELDSYKNYFDNLDVQEEINKKLDEMVLNGTLTNLIKQYIDPIYQSYESTINQNIDNFENNINSTVADIQSQVDGLASGSPLVASNTSDMTDTTKIYVNTTDGKWYYYDGTDWTAGGTYQSDGLGNSVVLLSNLNNEVIYNLNTRTNNKDNLNAFKEIEMTFTDNNEAGIINTSTGEGESGNAYRTKYFIYLPPYSQLEFYNDNVIDYSQLLYVCYYDKNFTYLNTYKWNNFIPTNKESCYIKISFNNVVDLSDIKMKIKEYPHNEIYYTNNLFNKNGDNPIGVYVNSNGAFDVNTSYKCSNFIKIKANTDYTLSKGRFLGFYDDKFDFVSRQTSPNNFSFNVAYDGYVIISYEDSYVDSLMLVEGESLPAVYVPYVKYLDSSIKVNTENISLTTDVLYNKKYVALGDSFTHGDFTDSETNDYYIEDGLYQGQYKVYPYLIGNRCLMQVSNLAVNGMSLAQYGDSSNVLSKDGGLYTQLPLDVDYITIKIGINDDNNSVPIGDINDTSNTTFYGAWNKILPYLIQKHPQAKIGLIITNGIQSNPAWAEASINIAKKYGLAYLDEATDYKVPTLIRTNKTLIPQSINTIRNNNWYVNTSTNWHPNEKCHEFESYIVENFLRSL